MGKYRLQALAPGPEVASPETELRVQTFPLSHVRPGKSAAFLLRCHDDYLLYLSDTGADELEQSH